MLNAGGVCLILFACSALGFEKSRQYAGRIRQLRELQRMTLLLIVEITYRKAALPEALMRTAGKIREPFAGFLKKTAQRADAFDSTRFSELFAQEAESAFQHTQLTGEDRKELMLLGQYLGYLDIDMQENTIALYLQELEQKIRLLQEEMPARQKLYQSMGILGGIFISILFLP